MSYYIGIDLGISGTVRVCAGAGDNAAAAVSTGVVGKYEARYQQFKKIYPAVKNLFPEIQ